VEDQDNDVTEEDKPTMTTCLEMTQTEFALLETLIRVYDHARSHFISEICEPSVKRYLNAIRIRVEENAERMPFSLYRSTLLDRMQNRSVIDGLISFILKPRENNCTLSLWVAERVAERRSLHEDGIEMSEDTWLELILAFVASEERQILHVPARETKEPSLATTLVTPWQNCNELWQIATPTTLKSLGRLTVSIRLPCG
jgi:hypothetical protein